MNKLALHISRRQRGLTLVELMVAIAIAMVVVLAATSILVVGQQHNRVTASTNDASQSGAFAAYALDRAVRSAGSGFAQSWDQGIFGCKLNVTKAAVNLLPRATDFPEPFKKFLTGKTNTLAVAPLLIGQGMSQGGSDVLLVMGGNGAAGDVARPIKSSAAGGLRLDNTIGMVDGDLGLVSQQGTANCLLESVKVTDADTFKAIGNDVLPIGGDYEHTTDLDTFANSGTAAYSVLGNNTAKNVQFQMFGTGTNRVLTAYDLLTDTTQDLADGVLELHAIYGIDTDTPHDNKVNSWVAPTGDWALDKVLADPKKMRQIIAVRIALVMRSSTYDKEEVATERPELFPDMATGVKIPAAAYDESSEERHFRLRVIDTTIPLRNMLLLAAS